METQSLINQIRDLLDQLEEQVSGEKGPGDESKMPPEMLADLAAAPSPQKGK